MSQSDSHDIVELHLIKRLARLAEASGRDFEVDLDWDIGAMVWGVNLRFDSSARRPRQITRTDAVLRDALRLAIEDAER